MAGTRNLFTTWSSRSVRITELLKHTSCRYVFSASLTSFCSGTSNDMKFVKRPSSTNPSSLRYITKNFTRRNRLFINLQKHENANLKDLTSNRNFDERWISTSAICLNEETSISTGKRKIKERIEKVKEIVHRESILTIPNFLSAFRIVAAPFLGYFIISEEFTIAVTLFAVAGITDMLDGYIARNFKNQMSVFGTILDPVADKVLMSVLAVSLTVAELLPIPLAALILSRDFLLILASFYFRFKSLPPPRTISRYFDVNLATVELRPNLLGKANTVLQLGLVGSTLLAPVLGYVDHQYLHVLWYLVGTSTVLSSISYLFSANTAVRYLK